MLQYGYKEKKKRPQQMYFSKEIKLKNFLDLHKYNITNVDNVKRRLKKESTFALISVVRFWINIIIKIWVRHI